MTNSLISVIIPTCNRLGYLSELLTRLLPEAQKLGVPVCVSDNHSTDGTAVFLREMRTEFSNLHFQIQHENVGIDRNMLAAIAMANSEYVFPLGDDDSVLAGGLAEIMSDLECNCDLLVLEGWHTDPNLVPLRGLLPQPLQGQTFNSTAEAFCQLWDLLPFGSFVAKRSCYSEIFDQSYVGTSHAYSCVMWENLVKLEKHHGPVIRCSSKKTVCLRGAEKTWRKDEARIMLLEIPKSFQLLEERVWNSGEIEAVKQEYVRTVLNLRKLVYYRSQGQLERRLYQEIRGRYNTRERMLMRVVMLLPVKMLHLVVMILRNLKT